MPNFSEWGTRVSGLFDNARRLMNGSGRSTVPLELRPGETETTRVVASALFGGLTAVGGDLVVTNQRVVFVPLNVRDVAPLLSKGLKAADVSGASALVGWLQKQIDGSETSMDRVVSARAGSGGSLFKPPTVLFKLADGRDLEFGVLAGRTSMNLSAKNRTVRDQLVSTLTA